MQPEMSVCVAAYQRHPPPNLGTLGEQLEAAWDGLAGELVVALNGISAGEAAIPPGARTVPLAINRGVAPGWNAAAYAARGRTLVFANDDVELEAGSLRLLHEALERQPAAGVVGPAGARWDVRRGAHVEWVDLAGLPAGQARECDAVSGFLFAVRSETFERAGGFDEAYAPFSYEEVDFCTAVRFDLGLRCYAVAGVGHVHEFGVTRAWRPWQRIRFDGRSESVWSIDRRNRRQFRAKWSERARAGPPDRALARPRKVLCSIGIGAQRRLLTLSRPTFADYAARHGYQLRFASRPLDGSRPPAWSKVVLIRELLRHHDIVLWVDADALIVDPAHDISSELADDEFLGLVEHSYRGQAHPNTGVMVLRAGPDADAFLEEVWNATDLVEHQWWEQAAVMRALGYELDPPRRGEATRFRERTRLLSKDWNSIPDDPAPDPRIKHYPGWSVKTRFALMALERVRGALRGRGRP